ncbi:multivesicular body subunit 12B-like [Physella acuta]|uniref:multivesicular body subunit 12B-like n=1 Tax=Physella acuta TaxID=109671 RepID=UPI0027DCA012|nr:multivesicular body subunit 12B-like [Physella acuta]
MDQDLPIIGVCIVSEPGKCPANYTLIDRTFDRNEDADLWKDGLFTRKNMRYLCVERQIATPNRDVLVDVTIIGERDNIPPGFSVISETHDSKEKATQKKLICVRWMIPSMTSDAITELIFTSRVLKKPPQGFTLVGEINMLQLCYKMGKIQTSTDQVMTASSVQSYSSTPQLHGLAQPLPYTLPPATIARPLNSGQATLSRTGPPEQSANSLATSHVNPISGIEWKINQKYKLILELQNLSFPDLHCKTLGELEQQYKYDFSVERSVSKNPALRTP